ncbi:MAG TPA: hypothetical protein VMT03_16795 [Polyangia bacterium]|nr:hypothetical protein [Polyangia bacterium]
MTSTKRNGLSNLTCKLAGLAVLALGTLAASGSATAAGTVNDRGTVVARGQSSKVVVAGPVALHVYSQSSGGAIYTVPSVTGTDKDCSGAAGPVTPIAAETVAHISVGEGRVACVSTSTRGAFELVWHATERPAPTAIFLAKADR